MKPWTAIFVSDNETKIVEVSAPVDVAAAHPYVQNNFSGNLVALIPGCFATRAVAFQPDERNASQKMKVAELKEGMVLRFARTGLLPWVVDGSLALPSGDGELRFVNEHIAGLVKHGRIVPLNTLVVYLGGDRTLINGEHGGYMTLLRRVLVCGRTLVIDGCNVRYLEPHPEFN